MAIAPTIVLMRSLALFKIASIAGWRIRRIFLAQNPPQVLELSRPLMFAPLTLHESNINDEQNSHIVSTKMYDVDKVCFK